MRGQLGGGPLGRTAWTSLDQGPGPTSATAPGPPQGAAGLQDPGAEGQMPSGLQDHAAVHKYYIYMIK